MPDIMKPKRSTESIANVSDKVLEKDEMLVITPDAGSGKGKYKFKFGDGVTSTKNLPIAVDGEKADDMKVSEFTTPADENPILSAGDTISDIVGKQVVLNTKIGYERLNTLATALGAVEQSDFVGLVSLLNDLKFNKSDLHDGLDSTSIELGATANSLRKVNEKTDINATAITRLNSDLGKIHPAPAGKKIELTVSQNGQAFIAPADGFYNVLYYKGFCSLVGKLTSAGNNPSTFPENPLALFLPVNKGDSINIWYSAIIIDLFFIPIM